MVTPPGSSSNALVRAPVALTVACLVAAAVLIVPAAPHGVAQSRIPRFERADCWVAGDWARDVRRECGWLVVPESRGRSSSRTIRLAVEIFRAKEPNGTPPLVFLHGGPGGRGIGVFSEGVARNPRAVIRDVVIYDQRGSGFSEPKLCPDFDRLAAAGYNLRDEAELERRLSEGRRVCLAELAAQGADPLAYTTLANVADLIALRRTLGYASWDVLAPSYGARLAQEAMARDGRAIRAVALLSPTARSFSMEARMPLSTRRAMERVFAACRLDPSCRAGFPNVEEDFYAAFDTLTASPFGVPLVGSPPDSMRDTVWLDGRRLLNEIRDILNQPRTMVARLPLLLHELRAGDRARAAREIVGTGTMPPGYLGQVVRELINCSDHYASGAAYRKTLDSANALVRPPFRRVADPECDEWLPGLADRPLPAPVRSGIPTLILTGAYDDRTPTDFARRIAATLRRATVVEFPDEGHGGGPPQGCRAAVLIGFLHNPTLVPDTSCVATIPPIHFATTWEPARAP